MGDADIAEYWSDWQPKYFCCQNPFLIIQNDADMSYGSDNYHSINTVCCFNYFNRRPPKICVDHPAYQLGGVLGDSGFFVSCITAQHIEASDQNGLHFTFQKHFCNEIWIFFTLCVCLFVCLCVSIYVCHDVCPDDLTMKDWCHTNNILQVHCWRCLVVQVMFHTLMTSLMTSQGDKVGQILKLTYLHQLLS